MGSIGFVSQEFGNLFSAGSLAESIGPSFTWNILNYGRLRANVNSQDAQFRRMVYAYQNAVLRADMEVENALVRFEKTHDRIAELRQGVDALKNAVETATERYRGGLSDFQSVYKLDADVVQRQDELAIAQGELAGAFIAAYKALGGGWEVPSPGAKNPAALVSTSIPTPQSSEVSVIGSDDASQQRGEPPVTNQPPACAPLLGRR